jgi:hypothetical protein
VAAEAGATASAAADSAGTTFSRGHIVFAVADGNVAELMLEPEIAEAALRTPDTATSARGPAWVKLAPATVAERDLDRARAWFLSAWRNSRESGS